MKWHCLNPPKTCPVKSLEQERKSFPCYLPAIQGLCAPCHHHQPVSEIKQWASININTWWTKIPLRITHAGTYAFLPGLQHDMKIWSRQVTLKKVSHFPYSQKHKCSIVRPGFQLRRTKQMFCCLVHLCNRQETESDFDLPQWKLNSGFTSIKSDVYSHVMLHLLNRLTRVSCLNHWTPRVYRNFRWGTDLQVVSLWHFSTVNPKP